MVSYVSAIPHISATNVALVDPVNRASHVHLHRTKRYTQSQRDYYATVQRRPDGLLYDSESLASMSSLQKEVEVEAEKHIGIWAVRYEEPPT